MAFEYLPFLRLPNALYPKDRHINPPVFHYGYAFSIQWLCDYAEERGLLHECQEATKSSPLVRRMDFLETLESVFDYIIQEAQITSFTLEYQLLCSVPRQPEDIHMMCIFSNYKRKGKMENPEFEDVRKLQEFLHFSELPGWYLDYEQWGWAPRNIKRFTVS